MLKCRKCEQEISNKARICPQCGHPRYRCFEWKSELEIFGIPFIHIAAGRDPDTGKLKVAKGIIAIGQFAIGLISLAQVGVGVFFGLGQVMLGLIVIAQFALGLYFALGQVAIGMIAIGQVCLASYGLAQVGYALHLWTPEVKDPLAVEFFTELWNTIKSIFTQ